MSLRTLLEQAKVVYIKVQPAKDVPAYPAGADALLDVGCTDTFAEARKVENMVRHAGSFSKYPGRTAGFNGSKATIKCPIEVATLYTGVVTADIHGSCLMDALYGIDAPDAGNKKYDLTHRATTTTESWYTIAIDNDGYIVWLINCKVSAADLPFKADATIDDFTTLNTTWDCLSFAVAGQSYTVADVIAGLFAIAVVDPYKFSIGGVFKITGEAGLPPHTITNVNYTTGAITFTTAIAAGGITKDSLVYGYIATAAAPVNNTIYSATGYVLFSIATLKSAAAQGDNHVHVYDGTLDKAGLFEAGNQIKFEGDTTVYTVGTVTLPGSGDIVPVTPNIVPVAIAKDKKVYLIVGAMEGSLKWTESLKTEPREKKNSNWPTYSLRENRRDVIMDLTSWMTWQNAAELLFPWTEKEFEVIIEFGDVTGIPHIVLTYPHCQITKVSLDDAEFSGNKLPKTIQAFGSGSNDEETCLIQLS